MAMRTMAFAWRPMTSEEWLAVGRLLYGVKVSHVQDGRVHGEPLTLDITDEWLAKLVEDSKRHPGSYRWHNDFVFFCTTCDREFSSPVTPTVCSLCGRSADDEPQAVTLTHRGYTAKTFPFYAEVK